MKKIGKLDEGGHMNAKDRFELIIRFWRDGEKKNKFGRMHSGGLNYGWAFDFFRPRLLFGGEFGIIEGNRAVRL